MADEDTIFIKRKQCGEAVVQWLDQSSRLRCLRLGLDLRINAGCGNWSQMYSGVGYDANKCIGTIPYPREPSI